MEYEAKDGSLRDAMDRVSALCDDPISKILARALVKESYICGRLSILEEQIEEKNQENKTRMQEWKQKIIKLLL